MGVSANRLDGDVPPSPSSPASSSRVALAALMADMDAAHCTRARALNVAVPSATRLPLWLSKHSRTHTDDAATRFADRGSRMQMALLNVNSGLFTSISCRARVQVRAAYWSALPPSSTTSAVARERGPRKEARKPAREQTRKRRRLHATSNAHTSVRKCRSLSLNTKLAPASTSSTTLSRRSAPLPLPLRVRLRLLRRPSEKNVRDRERLLRGVSPSEWLPSDASTRPPPPPPSSSSSSSSSLSSSPSYMVASLSVREPETMACLEY
jgi:hypothetical protein